MLSEYLPEFMREVREFDCIMSTETEEIVDLRNTLNSRINDLTPSNAGADGIARWEKALGINVRADSDWAKRRDAVLVKLSDKPPYNLETLDAAAGRIYPKGHSLTLSFSEKKLVCVLSRSLEATGAGMAIKVYLQNRIPVGFGLEVSVGDIE